MEYNNTLEYETAQSRISSLLYQIEEQLKAIAANTNADCAEGLEDANPDSVMTEQDMSELIIKQSDLINAYQDRDANDERDSIINKLEAELNMSKRQQDVLRDLLIKAYADNRNLKSAIKSLTAVLKED